MAKGKKHYSGKELIVRRQIERQQKERAKGTIKKQQLQHINATRRAMGWAKQELREGNDNGGLLDKCCKSAYMLCGNLHRA